MDAYPASLLPSTLGRLDRETGMFLATVDSLSEDELRAPSRCDGWTLGHVVTHVARNADALCNLVHWARSGEETPPYPSPEARDRDISEGAGRSPSEMKKDVREACRRFAEAAEHLQEPLATDEVTLRGAALPARALVSIRLTEIVLHHADLDTVWELEEADPDAQLDALEEAVRRLRAQENVPAFTVRTTEKDEWSLGEGGVVVQGERPAVLSWLARGTTEGVTCDGDLPRVTPFT